MRLAFTLPAVFLMLLLGGALLPELGTAQGSKKIPQGPDVTVFFTGDGDGEITPCGCPKQDYGGSSRKAAFVDTLRTSAWDFLLLDAGGIAPFGELNLQAHLKSETLAKAMSLMQYDGQMLGFHDLGQGPAFVDSLFEWLGHPVVVATNYTLGENRSVDHVLLNTREKTVAVVGLFDPQLAGEEHAWLDIAPWEEARALMAELRESADVLVAMAAVDGGSRLRAAAELFPECDLIIGSHLGELSEINELVGSVRIVGSPPKGRYLGRMDLAFDPAGELEKTTCNYLPVIDKWGRRSNTDELVSAYYKDLKTLVTTEAFLSEQRQELKDPIFAYVGNQACISCHEPQHQQWETTGHALAKQTLEQDGKDHVPECQTCHSTGAGFKTGFVTPELTPDRWQVGCESCHGPGAGHLEDNHAPYGIIVEEACLDCHTDHDSPNFDYEAYLPKVAH